MRKKCSPSKWSARTSGADIARPHLSRMPDNCRGWLYPGGALGRNRTTNKRIFSQPMLPRLAGCSLGKVVAGILDPLSQIVRQRPLKFGYSVWVRVCSAGETTRLAVFKFGQFGRTPLRQLCRAHRLQTGTNTRAALTPYCSHHIEHVAILIDVSAGQLPADVPRPHND